ncbi:hypothetical protein DM01DRAFT_1336977 [Hesseltinella vesiculosa]|uniref:DNA helicase n=1 Tax=Hesseltinella vesiculosa TaxID=101127 RepID=A0A1X2GFL2_9FUNG|nr:hypothetical protein DM01DRAFT_1336977 [Hesseltinella vesiculosa]
MANFLSSFHYSPDQVKDPSDDEVVLVNPTKRRRLRRFIEPPSDSEDETVPGMTQSPSGTSGLDHSSSSSPTPPMVQQPMIKRGPALLPSVTLISDDSDMDEDTLPVRSSRSSQRLILSSDEDDDDVDELEAQASAIQLHDKPLKKKPSPIILDSDDDEGTQNSIKSDEEEEVLDDDSSEDGYASDDEPGHLDQSDLDALSRQQKLDLLAFGFSERQPDLLRKVLDDCADDVSLAIDRLSGASRRTLTERHRAALKLLSKQHRNTQVLEFFRTASLQELMDVTGCKASVMQKLIALRPFDSLDHLTSCLRDERGLSTIYIDNYRQLIEGYSTVDTIITKIEHIGAELQATSDAWQAALDDPEKKTEAHAHPAMHSYLHQPPQTLNKDLTLKSYQMYGLNWMAMLHRKKISGILADEMGLGKTAQVIAFLAHLAEQGHQGPHMIVVPTSTVDNWLREFDRFCPSLDVRAYQGTIPQRFELQMEIMDERDSIDAIITTYSQSSSRREDRSFFRKLNCASMILDEGHMVKNCESSRYQHLMDIDVPFRLLLTGTPLQNNLQELVSLLMFIMPLVFVGHEDSVREIFKVKSSGSKPSDNATQTSTHHQQQERVEINAAQLLSEQRIERAKKMMTPFVLRRRKCQVLTSLPRKIHKIERTPMTAYQQTVYDRVIEDSKEEYLAKATQRKQKGARVKKDDALFEEQLALAIQKSTTDLKPASNKQTNESMNTIMNLRKIVDHPLLHRYHYNDDVLRLMAKAIVKSPTHYDSNEDFVFEDMTIMNDFELMGLCKEIPTIREYALGAEKYLDACKVKQLEQLLEQNKKQGNKVLLFSQFTMMMDILDKILPMLGINYVRLDGSTHSRERQALIDQFNNDPTIDVFLLSTKAGGFGINLTSANVVIMYDMDVNPHNDRQAEDRAHRVGQTKDVTVYKLLAENSIEDNILAMAKVKIRLDESVSMIEQDTSTDDTSSLDRNDLNQLLRSVLLSKKV